jgi:hypothetical protein
MLGTMDISRSFPQGHVVTTVLDMVDMPMAAAAMCLVLVLRVHRQQVMSK